MRIRREIMRDWAGDVFRAVGLSAEAAAAAADNLAFAEARGVKSHGFLRVPIYIDRIRAGGIVRDARTSIETDHGALVTLDAHHAIGALSGVDATRLAIERARRYGIGCAIVVNANHFGATAFYTNLMADAGMFGIAAGNADKAMAPPFGGRRVLGTNPIAMAVPVPREERPQLDMATSEVSLGKLLVAAQEGEPIPLGWALDREGRPTTVAGDVVDGALVPSGGPKGFGLAFMIDALVALAGAKTSERAGPLYGDPAQPQELGLVFIAIQGEAGTSAAEYGATIRGLSDAVHASGPGPTGIPALFPGEPELRKERELGDTIEVTPALLAELAPVADSSGVPLPLSVP